MFKRMFQITMLALMVALASCASTTEPMPTLEKKADELALAPFAAVQFPQGFGIHGIDASRELWFAAVALPPGVHVARRLTGEVLGELPPPPEGFGAPVAVRVAPGGRVVVLDGVVAPQAAGSAPAKLYEYEVTSTWHGFTATLVASRTLPLIALPDIFVAIGPEPRPAVNSGIFFPIMMTILPNGAAVMTDTVTGSAWVSDPTRTTYRNAFQDPRLRPVPHAPIVGKGRAPGGGTRDYTFDVTTPPGVFPGAFGVAYLAATDEVVFANPSQGGLWALPYTTFMSTADPTTKSASLRPLVASPQLGVTDLVAGLDTNRWDSSDPWVYFQRVAADEASGFKNVMARVHGVTGAVQVLARSSTVFDFDVAISVVEPLLPIDHIATVGSGVGQEENNPSVNALLGGVGTFVAPTPIAAVITTY